MKITEMKYMKRINLGNYEHEEFGAVVQVEEGETESVTNIAAGLKDFVNENLGKSVNDISEPSPKKENEEAPKKKNSKKKAESEPEEKTDPVDEFLDAVSEGEEEVELEDELVDEEEAPKTTKKKTSKKKTSAKKTEAAASKKYTKYDNKDDLHKKLLIDFVNAEYKDRWKKDKEAKAAVTRISQEKVGDNFLDEKGDILLQFKAPFRKELTRILNGK